MTTTDSTVKTRTRTPASNHAAFTAADFSTPEGIASFVRSQIAATVDAGPGNSLNSSGYSNPGSRSNQEGRTLVATAAVDVSALANLAVSGGAGADEAGELLDTLVEFIQNARKMAFDEAEARLEARRAKLSPVG